MHKDLFQYLPPIVKLQLLDAVVSKEKEMRTNGGILEYLPHRSMGGPDWNLVPLNHRRSTMEQEATIANCEAKELC